MTEDFQEINRLLQQIQEQGNSSIRLRDFWYLLMSGFAGGMFAGVCWARFWLAI